MAPSRDVSTGATRPLTALAITKLGTWVVTGDGGFIARSPDGTWFSRVTSEVEVDLEAIATLTDGRLIVVGDHGQILVSSDDGRTWRGVTNDLGLVHLWSVERFGDGVLIGGDDGLVVQLAAPGDRTWSDRIERVRWCQAARCGIRRRAGRVHRGRARRCTSTPSRATKTKRMTTTMMTTTMMTTMTMMTTTMMTMTRRKATMTRSRS